jgi:hypothetical protein
MHTSEREPPRVANECNQSHNQTEATKWKRVVRDNAWQRLQKGKREVSNRPQVEQAKQERARRKQEHALLLPVALLMPNPICRRTFESLSVHSAIRASSARTQCEHIQARFASQLYMESIWAAEL